MTVEDVLVNGDIEKTAEFGINDHSALVERMEAEKVFEEVLPEPQVQNLADYFVTLPSEVAMKLWSVMGNGAVENTAALHQAQSDGRSVSAHIVELLTGEEVNK